MILPNVSYDIGVNMYMDVIPMSNKGVDIFDWGTDHDQYTTTLKFVLPTADASAFAEKVESTYRGVAVSLNTLLGGAYPQFHPFGPHVDLTSNDDIKIVKYGDKGKFNTFGDAWTYTLEIAPAGPLTYYDSYVGDCGGAGFNFGGLTNFYLPELIPSIEYKVYSSRFGSGTFLHHNAENTQHKSVIMRWENIKTEGARNILLELVRYTRSITTTLNAGSIQWPFSLRAGQGNIDVKIANTMINVSNTVANMWTVECEVIDVN